MLHHLAHPYTLIGVVVAVFVGLLGHNLAQAATARVLGDGTAARQGWLKLSLSRQVNPFGAVAALLVSYGWSFLAPVPMATRFRRERPRTAAALLAGPVFLFLLLVLGLLGLRGATSGGGRAHLAEMTGAFAFSVAGLLITSLLPVPPLTGGRLFFLYAPPSPGWQRARQQLEGTQLGVVIALGVLLLPVAFPSFPDVVGQLAEPLWRNLGRALGIAGLAR